MKFEDLTRKVLIDNENGLDGFTKDMGIVVRSIEDTLAVVDMKISEKLQNPIGSVHGGALFTLADIASGLVATADGTKATTLDSNIRFVKAVFVEKSQYVRATATLKKTGKKVRVVEVEIADDKGELLCIATFGFFVL